MALVSRESPRLEAPKIRAIRRDSRGSLNMDDEGSQNAQLEEGMHFFEAFQDTPTKADEKVGRGFKRSENSCDSLDSAEYELNEAVSAALVGENVLDSPPRPSAINTGRNFVEAVSAPPPQINQDRIAGTFIRSHSPTMTTDTASALAHTLDISLGLVAQGFSWIKSQREERRRRILQQQAAEQAKKIREAQMTQSEYSGPGGILSTVCGEDLNRVVDQVIIYSYDECDDERIVQKTGISYSGDGFSVEFAVPPKPEEDVDWVPPVRIQDEENITSAPYILTESQRQLVAQHVLPAGIAYAKWKRLYSLARDGDSFEACLRMVAGHAQTLLVLRTSTNEVLGGFGDCAWDHPTIGNAYFGGPTSCLFSFVKVDKALTLSGSLGDDLADDDDDVRVYKWTGANRYIQLCDLQRKILAFGGGGVDGAFGLSVAQDFQHGSSGPCDTFGNEPLASERNFAIVDLEIFSFLLGQF